MDKLIKKLELEIEQQREFCSTLKLDNSIYDWERGYLKGIEFSLKQLKLFVKSLGK